jgi:murein DD-endopeptidase MepM/ murein hydrolase activator NlpD
MLGFFLLVIPWLSITLISSFSSSGRNLSMLEKENKELRDRIDKLTDLYQRFGGELKEFRIENNYLRLATNLPVVSEDEAALGFGGNEFEEIFSAQGNVYSNLDNLSKYVESLSKKLSFEKTVNQKISDQLKENKILYASIPAIKPCEGEIGLNGFGMREHPILGISKMHEGIDIITNVGTKVKSAGDGIVTFVGYRGGYGLVVEVEHHGGYKTVYGHLSSSLITEGRKVIRGKVIALSGNSGLSTGPHLHYEVHHNGIKLDPAQFFFDDLALFEQKNTK